jgi:Trk-type K+ transport system membrane component
VISFIIGGISFLSGIAFAVYYAYLQWFVHPEYTQPMMFWNYWHIDLAVLACFVVTAICWRD